VLTGLKKIKVCTGYKYDGKIYEEMPGHQSILHKCTPVYEELKCWDNDISEAKSFDDLPPEAQDYIRYIENVLKIPVSMISVGAERSKIIIKDDILKNRLFDEGRRSTLIV
jgi:adenylosuccinate synthase